MPVAPCRFTGVVQIPDAVAILDNLIDERLAAALLRGFVPLKDGHDQSWSTVLVPSELECRMRGIVTGDQSIEFEPGGSAPLSMSDCVEPWVPMPGRVAKGSTHMHHDASFDSSGAKEDLVDGYVAVLYLAGHGSLVIDCGSGECAIDVKPGRLILWPNKGCLHRLDASPGDETRIMIGPMHLEENGLWRRAGLHADWYWAGEDYAEQMKASFRRDEEERMKEELQAEEAVVLQLASDFDSSTGKLAIQAMNLAGDVEFELSMDSLGRSSTLQSLRTSLKNRHRATLMVGTTKLPRAEGPGSDPDRRLSDTPLVRESHFEAEFHKYESEGKIEEDKAAAERKIAEDKVADMDLREKVQEVFRKCDANGDGTLSLEELTRLVRAIDPTGMIFGTGGRLIQRLFNKIDTNGDGKIDFDELFAWLYAHPGDALLRPLKVPLDSKYEP